MKIEILNPWEMYETSRLLQFLDRAGQSLDSEGNSFNLNSAFVFYFFYFLSLHPQVTCISNNVLE